MRESFCADLSAGAEGLPGIQRIGAISHLPLSGANAGRALTVEGFTPSPGRERRGGVSSDLPRLLLHARHCRSSKAATSIIATSPTAARVVIVNRAMADAYWKKGESPIGRRLKLGGSTSENPWATVVGITENVRHFGLDSEARREIFMPYAQAAWPVMTVVAKTVGEPMLWQSSLRDVVKRVDPDLPVARVQSMEAVVSSSVNWRETPMRLLTGIRVDRTAARVDWRLRRAGLLRIAAHSRDRRARGAWRHAAAAGRHW